MSNVPRLNEKDRAFVDAVLTRLKDAPTMENLEEAGRDVGREIRGGFNWPAPASGVARELIAVAVDGGIERAVAEAIFKAGVDKGRAEYEAAIKAEPAQVAQRQAVENIKRDKSLTNLRSTVYAMIKVVGLTPEQIGRENLIRAMGLSFHAVDDAARRHAQLAERAIDDGIAAALATWGDDTSATAAIRATPTLETLSQVITENSYQDDRFIATADFERLMNVAILEAEGIVLLPEIERNDEIAAEVERIRQTPTLRQFRESALKVARRGDQVSLAVLEVLADVLGNPDAQPQALAVPADTMLIAIGAPMAAREDIPRLEPKSSFHDPARRDYQPIDGWAPEPPKLEPARRDEQGNILLGEGRPPEHLCSPGNRIKRDAPITPITKAKAKTFDHSFIERTLDANKRISENHDSLAARRKASDRK